MASQSTSATNDGQTRGSLLNGLRWLPSFAWQKLTRHLPKGRLHLIFTLADHFEPGYVPGDGQARAPYDEQERRLEQWCRHLPKLVERWRDADGQPFNHTYFYPAEQYDRAVIDRLAEHCHAGWGEIEVHLHHGMHSPDSAENTRKELVRFRDRLAMQHGCLSYLDNSTIPRYAFVHGNFALANSARGQACGVDSEMQVLADTGCYADMTLPTGALHPAQIAKINSIYECALPLYQRAPHRKGHDLRSGRRPQTFPLIVQGPLAVDFVASKRSRFARIENGALTGATPATLRRLQLWKRTAIRVQGRPDWLFIKLHCHGMDVSQQRAVLGEPMLHFLRDLVEGARERNEVLHFASAREMVNIILAACDGREGNPGEYRDYRLRQRRADSSMSTRDPHSQVIVKG
jgi:hypothetical protein